MSDDFLQTLVAGGEPQTALTIYDPVVAAANDNRQILDKDFDDAREALTKTMATATKSLEDFAKLASQLQDPRSYDVLSKLIASSTTAAKALLEIHKHKKDGKEDNGAEGAQVTNNTVIMTMEDMRKILQERITTVQEDEAEDEAAS